MLLLLVLLLPLVAALGRQNATGAATLLVESSRAKIPQLLRCYTCISAEYNCDQNYQDSTFRLVECHGICVKKAFHDPLLNVKVARGCSTVFEFPKDFFNSSFEGCKHYHDDRYQGKTTVCFCHTEGCNGTPRHRTSTHVMLAAMALALLLPKT